MVFGTMTQRTVTIGGCIGGCIGGKVGDYVSLTMEHEIGHSFAYKVKCGQIVVELVSDAQSKRRDDMVNDGYYCSVEYIIKKA